MNENVGATAGLSAGLIARTEIGGDIVAPAFTFDVVCTGADGVEKWRESFHNTVMTVGKTDIVDKYFKGSSYTAAFYMGIKGTGTQVAGDTMASHAGWSEVTGYSAGTRPAITFGTTSSGSNTATAVTFSINATVTCAGAFITTDSTKSGTSGTLYSAGDFAASRSAVSGDTLSVTATVSVS
jgi:hypothetical protein